MSAWDPREVIAAKRDGEDLPEPEVERFVLGVGSGDVSDAQAAAFLMAAFLKGLDRAETLAMTRAMIASGATVNFPGIGRPTLDKHSTGGVADGVTLLFAPIAAAMGLGVAKLSGRGLGHTGGTLDKMEAIPGLRTDLTPQEIQRQVESVGCAVAAQSAAIVPADGALYALRDATATVPSIPLIAASVMSKKLAVESDLIVLDVKAGSGAFMRSVQEAAELARTCRDLATGAGRAVGVAVTDMDQPLGYAVGNAIDVAEAVRILRAEGSGRLRELAVWFASRSGEHLLGLSPDEAHARAELAISDGSALERFRAMVEAQGGDPRVVDDPSEVLPRAPVVVPLTVERSGVVATVDAEAIGVAAARLGAGRLRKEDTVDPAVGIEIEAKIGDRVDPAQPVGRIHARTDGDAALALTRVRAALTIGPGPVDAPPLIHDWMAPEAGS